LLQRFWGWIDNGKILHYFHGRIAHYMMGLHV